MRYHVLQLDFEYIGQGELGTHVPTWTGEVNEVATCQFFNSFAEILVENVKIWSFSKNIQI